MATPDVDVVENFFATEAADREILSLIDNPHMTRAGRLVWLRETGKVAADVVNPALAVFDAYALGKASEQDLVNSGFLQLDLQVTA